MRRKAELAQLRAIIEPAPLKDIGFAGGMPGFVQDTNAMSGAQRQMYLPKQSTADPVADAQAQGQRQANDVNADMAFNAMVQRRRLIEQMGGGPSLSGR
jgi:hypothetical protein